MTIACERNLHTFVQEAWPTVTPGDAFVDNWHSRAFSPGNPR